MISIFKTVKNVFFSVVSDRVIQTGSATSSVSIWGGLNARDLIANYAAVVGALTATATLVYMILKIKRMLRNPEAED